MRTLLRAVLVAAALAPAAPAVAQWEVKLQPAAGLMSPEDWAQMNAAFASALTKNSGLTVFEQMHAIGAVLSAATRVGSVGALAAANSAAYGPELFDVGYYDLDNDGKKEMFVRPRRPLGECDNVVGCETYVLRKDAQDTWQLLGWFAVARVKVFPVYGNKYEAIDDGERRWVWNGRFFDPRCDQLPMCQ